MTYLILFYFI